MEKCKQKFKKGHPVILYLTVKMVFLSFSKLLTYSGVYITWMWMRLNLWSSRHLFVSYFSIFINKAYYLDFKTFSFQLNYLANLYYWKFPNGATNFLSMSFLMQLYYTRWKMPLCYLASNWIFCAQLNAQRTVKIEGLCY